MIDIRNLINNHHKHFLFFISFYQHTPSSTNSNTLLSNTTNQHFPLTCSLLIIGLFFKCLLNTFINIVYIQTHLKAFAACRYWQPWGFSLCSCIPYCSAKTTMIQQFPSLSFFVVVFAALETMRCNACINNKHQYLVVVISLFCSR